MGGGPPKQSCFWGKGLCVKSCSILQVGLEFTTYMPQPTEHWLYGALPCPDRGDGGERPLTLVSKSLILVFLFFRYSGLALILPFSVHLIFLEVVLIGK